MLEILCAVKEDASAITAIKTRAYNQEIQTYLGRDGGPEGYDEVESELKIIQTCMAYKIMLQGRIIGAFFLWMEKKDTAHFEDFVIEPLEQGKGLGYQVLLHLEKLHPEIHLWKLSTPVFSVGNQHLYQKAGFLEERRNEEEVFYCKYR